MRQIKKIRSEMKIGLSVCDCVVMFVCDCVEEMF